MKSINFKLLVAALLILGGFYFIPFKTIRFQPAAVIFPNGAEIIEPGQTYNFQWTPGRGVLKIEVVSENGGGVVPMYIVTPVYNETYGRSFGDTSGSLLAEANPKWFSKTPGTYRLKMTFDDGGVDLSDQPFIVPAPASSSAELVPTPTPSLTPTPTLVPTPISPPARVPTVPKFAPTKQLSPAPKPIVLPEKKLQPQQQPQPQPQMEQTQTQTEKTNTETKKQGFFSRLFRPAGSFFESIFGRQPKNINNQYK